MADKTVWTHRDMNEAAREWWGDGSIKGKDCRVIAAEDGDGNPCLVVLHRPTGRTSAEAGDGGRWHLDGTAYGD